MAKELRISASIPLPVDFGERTDLMVKLNPAVKALSEALGVAVTVSDVSVKGPRVVKPDDPAATASLRLLKAAVLASTEMPSEVIETETPAVDLDASKSGEAGVTTITPRRTRG